MSYIIKSGSRQYIVKSGQRLAVDRLKTASEGDIIDLPVLLSFGEDKKAKKTTLKATVVSHTKGKKIRVVKFKSKSNYHRVQGFRPYLTVLEIAE